VQYLFVHGADINARELNDRTPLHYAAGYGNLELMQLLIDKGANLMAKEQYGGMPLHDAVSEGHLEIAKYLRANGDAANINTKGIHNKTPLHYEAGSGPLELI
jgi:cytohesin